jgi:hypothetical protein
MSNSQEQLNTLNQKHSIEASQSAVQQLEKLDNSLDTTVELSPRDIETRAEKARTEARQAAISVEIKSKDVEKSKNRPSSSYRGSINNKQRNESYSRTLKQVQSELPTGGRIFSKITHNRLVEKTSDVVGNTIARPNAMLSGAIAAFLLTLLTYTLAKIIGYALSGFETIAAFIIGWLLGVIYDYLRVLVTGKKS